MSTQTGLEELGTDELHTLMAETVQQLPIGHPVRLLWERMDGILTAGGPECLPAPWDGPDEVDHEQCDARISRLNGEVDRLRAAVTNPVGAAIRSVHQRGHDIAVPLELLEFFTGGAETAALAEPEALPRDNFEVVNNALSSTTSVAEGLRCTKCTSITTQAGHDGKGWTLARLDLLADRHRCLPRAEDTDDSSDSVMDEIQDCTCVEFCNEDPKTACSLSGRPHVHPASHRSSGFGPCPVHPDAPGDL
ncbi:hypothetical protein ACIQPR_45065 [Streptomyces sp. NPDC091280]|uniref:hypothetical protein n=1 Tax=Streptomyces sp. NPDC091280 TaxID=3365984 RepID=UPI003803A1FB